MRNTLSTALVIGLSFCSLANAATPPADQATGAAKPNAAAPAVSSALKTNLEKISYSIGIDLGNNFKQQEIHIDEQLFMQGIKDGMNGESKLMSKEDVIATLKDLQKQLLDRRADQMKKLADENLKTGNAFLAENKKKEGVVSLPSGLQYKILVEGKGESPKATDLVTTNYRGMLINGTEFDSSYKRGEPATFPLNSVIPGWSEALQLMKPGAKWQLFIPAGLAYGEHGAGGQIGPNETLIFEVELLSFKAAEDASKAGSDGNAAKKLSEAASKKKGG